MAFNDEISQFTVATKNHADNFNDVNNKLLENDLYLRERINEVEKNNETNSVKNFGAKGDGVTDDTEAIQNAINNCDSLFFPEGVYIISKGIYMTKPINIFGRGVNSIIRLINSAGKIDMVNCNGVDNLTIKDICIDGNKDNLVDNTVEVVCLKLLSCTRVSLMNVTIINSTIEGAYLYKCKFCNITNCIFEGNGFYRTDASGLHIDTCSYCNVSNCCMIENGFHGLIMSSATYCNLFNLQLNSNGWDGARVQWSSNYNSFGNIQSAYNTRGIYFIEESNHNNLSNCYINNNEGVGVASNNSQDNIVFLSNIFNNLGNGYELVSETDTITFSQCLFAGNTLGDGTYPDGATVIIK